MRVVVLDLEMNQPSNNIIQIGAVLINIKSGIIEDKFNMICNPEELPSEYITNLTGITVEQVQKSEHIFVVINKFWEWVEKCNCGNQIWAWGSDTYELKEQSNFWKCKTPTKIRNLNIKEMSKIFRTAIPKIKSHGGVKDTMNKFGLEFIGKEHDALVDATNTANLLYRFYRIIDKSLYIEKLMREEF